MEHTPLYHAVLETMDEVEQSFRSQAGDASFCQLQKDGRVTGGIKYDEGRLVALNLVIRMLRECPESDPTACAGALAAERQSWLDALVAVQAKEPPATAWIAYRQGGADALTWALALLA